ncbi:MAG: ATP-binding protein [Streptosporangiaceae bacterium]|nr:ATP-binding protein [Streptosporangiaceae bacterium]MBV9857063.1 ATP-binding protein [Streptosporangiaceae bacterium]
MITITSTRARRAPPGWYISEGAGVWSRASQPHRQNAIMRAEPLLSLEDEHSVAMPWPLSSSLSLGALPTAVAAARAHARAVLAEWGMRTLANTAELVVSELVTNAVRASTGADGHPVYRDGRLAVVHVRLFGDGGRLLIEVWDGSPAAPVAKDAGLDDESGRGLQLVESVSESWGWTTADDWPGKCVWVELRTP